MEARGSSTGYKRYIPVGRAKIGSFMHTSVIQKIEKTAGKDWLLFKCDT